MATEIKNENVTGLNNAPNRKVAELDLVERLFMAADYKKAADSIVEIDITRKGEVLFTVHIHPIGDDDVAKANKEAAIMVRNPNGKHLPKVQADSDKSKYKSWLIYLATTEEDQNQIWGNPALMKKLNAYQPWETIDKLLTLGDKAKMLEKITEISGLDDEEDEMDEEEFQS